MSTINFEYIEICKKQLEQKFSFGNGHGYTQKDLELLSNYIEEQTGVTISLSTLKRLWKNNFKQGPQLATLNALVNVLGYENWQHFKLENNPEKKSDKNTTKIPEAPLKKKKNTIYVLILDLGILICGAVIFFLFFDIKQQKDIQIDGAMFFKANKTITKGTPNTVIFNYDVSNVKADSFFIQQSWNQWRRKKIDPKQKIFTDIYYEAGYHRAKLFANDSIIAKFPIHILSDGWESHLVLDHTSSERHIDFKGESYINDGILHIPEKLLLKKNISLLKYFSTRVSYSDVFNISSDNFSFVTKVKLDQNQFNDNCPWFNILIVTEKHIFTVEPRKKGCENHAGYKLGEIYRGGKNTDLSLLGIDIFNWNEIGVKVKDKHATIFINGETTYSENFKEDFGKIVGLIYIFEGTGSIDSTKLSTPEGKIIFEDQFD